MRSARAALLAVTTLLALMATACGDGPSSSSAASSGGGSSVGSVVNGKTATVTVKETDANVFDPSSANVSVKAGGIVEWKNTGSNSHNVTFKQYDDITSGNLGAASSYEVAFTTPGTYDYVCTIHESLGMKGTITVTA
jgi:plastocyanin